MLVVRVKGRAMDGTTSGGRPGGSGRSLRRRFASSISSAPSSRASQPKPGRLDNQEVIFWDEDVAFNGSRGAYSLITRAPTQNDISTQPLAIRRFLSKDPFNCSSAMRHPDNESCWRDGTVLGGTVPDALDDSTHPRSATPGANQSWDTWPVEFGSGQVWKVEKT